MRTQRLIDGVRHQSGTTSPSGFDRDCTTHPDIAALFQREGETWDDFLVRVGRLYRAAAWARPQGRPPVTGARLLALLGDGAWARPESLAERAGVSVPAIRQAVYRARKHGVPIQRDRRRGYRLQREETAA